MKISVIAIFYNSELYIKDCLNSILYQKGVDLEVIAVDDCSKDATPVILKAYQEKHPNLKVVTHTHNKGISEARNSGMREISSDAFFLIDGDDYLSSEYALQTLATLYDENTDWVQGSYLEVYENKILRHIYPKNSYDGFEQICDNFDKLDFILIHNKLINSKFKKNLLATGCFHEDRIWNAEVFNRLKKIKSVDAPTYSYRMHSGQTTRNPRNKKLYIISALKCLHLMCDCPTCWSNMRDTFQIIHIEKPLYLYEKDADFRREIIKESKSINRVKLDYSNFPRATKYIHMMINYNIPDFVINIFSKSYVAIKKLLGKPI